MIAYKNIFVFQLQINYLGNYIPNTWTFETGCTECHKELNPLKALKVSSQDFVDHISWMTNCLCEEFPKLHLINIEYYFNCSGVRQRLVSNNSNKPFLLELIRCLFFFFQQESEYPLVVIGIFIQQPTPFVTVFFERLLKLQYPKNRLKLFIYNPVTGV